MNDHRTLTLGVLTMALGLSGLSAGAGEAVAYRVRKDVLHRIDPRVFGQFMERPSWGEIGPEGALVPGTNQLQPEVLRLLQRMQLPIVRFPGGTDVDFIDWCDMVSNVPGRGAERPVTTGHTGKKVTNQFGYDEFLRFAEGVKTEPILVVNLREGLLKKKPLAEHALHVAGLVAYCNAPVGAKLPDGMPDWPAVRAKNGRREPYRVKYWQIGNETWAFLGEVEKLAPEKKDAYHAECIVAMAQAMLAVDPNIRFIIDGQGGTWASGEIARRKLADKVAYLVLHSYVPWTMKNVKRGEADVPAEKLSAAEIWNAWVATPDIDQHGLAVLRDGLLDKARSGGFRVAVTEWNWNGMWDRQIVGKVALNSSYAKGVGAAGYVHAVMRSSDVIDIGCQSMLVGNSWGIHAVWADAQGREAPRYMPTGQATMLYSLHHGENLLAMESTGVPTYAQPYRMGGLSPFEKVAVLDALATAGAKAVFFHVINRAFDKAMEVQVDLSDLTPLETQARHYILQGRLKDQPAPGESAQIAEITDSQVTFDGKTLKLTLPARSVSCIEIPRKQ
jgi:alpha-N-arabinofuranosidase